MLVPVRPHACPHLRSGRLGRGVSVETIFFLILSCSVHLILARTASLRGCSTCQYDERLGQGPRFTNQPDCHCAKAIPRRLPRRSYRDLRGRQRRSVQRQCMDRALNRSARRSQSHRHPPGRRAAPSIHPGSLMKLGPCDAYRGRPGPASSPRVSLLPKNLRRGVMLCARPERPLFLRHELLQSSRTAFSVRTGGSSWFHLTLVLARFGPRC